MRYRGVPIDQIGPIKHPLIYLDLLLKLLSDLVSWMGGAFVKRIVYVIILVVLIITITYVQSLHYIKQFIVFMCYWIILGVLSSIGLGTGLHTFVLYLGPHIAKVAIIASTCGIIPPMIPSRWNFNHFGQCHNQTNQHIGFLRILLAVQIQSFLWGFGTALGQLPPYFVAKKASETRLQLSRMNRQQENKKNDEESKKLLTDEDQNIIQIKQLKNKPDKSLMDRAKIVIFDNLQKYGFITVLLCASIPNPLFDLAGITCGHFRIPFKTFFTATFIGKAIIKVHIQMLFVITVFRKQSVDWLLKIIKWISQSAFEALEKTIEKQKQNWRSPSDKSENKTLISQLWDIFLILMIGYFIVSIVNGQIQQKAIKLKDKL